MKPVGRCRVCGSVDLQFLFSLGNQYVNDFVEPGHELSGVRCPIELELCRNCSLVQMRHTAPQELLYTRHYWYRSGVTETMRAALRDVVDCALKVVQPETGDVFLDIGSNDGTLLREVPRNLVRVGVEPATNLAEEGARGITLLINDFWDASQYEKLVGAKAKIITALGMFYDLEDPNKFIADVAEALHPEGLFVAQLMCLRNMVDRRDVGNLAHEHLEFYSLRSLGYLFHLHGLEIFDVEKNDVNGGSYRFYVRHADAPVEPLPGAYERIWEADRADRELYDPGTFYDWFHAVDENRKVCMSFVEGAVARGEKIWVYGASTKGNVILQYYGLDRYVVEGAAERSPEKWGKVTIGTGIPIYSEAEAREANPKYFFVLPYAFIDEFVKREAKWRAGGGRFIVPLPEFRIV